MSLTTSRIIKCYQPLHKLIGYVTLATDNMVTLCYNFYGEIWLQFKFYLNLAVSTLKAIHTVSVTKRRHLVTVGSLLSE